MIDHSDYIEAVENQLKSYYQNSESSHDWNHIQRVKNMAIYIQSKEGGDLNIIILGALLHDIADHKFNNNDFTIGGKRAFEFVYSTSKNLELANQIKEIVDKVSFKGANVPDDKLGIEGQIVRDADRIDALGAIGIARTFAYGGFKGNEIFNENQLPIIHDSKESYSNARNHTIAHFYEKLLLLKHRMETKTGKNIAEERHSFMISYLMKFFQELEFKFESTDFDLKDFS